MENPTATRNSSQVDPESGVRTHQRHVVVESPEEGYGFVLMTMTGERRDLELMSDELGLEELVVKVGGGGSGDGAQT